MSPSERADTATCRRLAESPAFRNLRPIIDPELDLVLIDCVECRAQDQDPLGLYRPATVRPRGRKVTIHCRGCGEHVRSPAAR